MHVSTVIGNEIRFMSFQRKIGILKTIFFIIDDYLRLCSMEVFPPRNKTNKVH